MNSDNLGSLLIVDDNAENIQMLGSILKKEKYAISVALNGAEALKLLKKTEVDLVLLDVMMPEMDGYEVCTILKNDERLKKIPVIFLTAKGEQEDIIKGFSVGAVDYIAKPFNQEELLARVSVHVELSRSREEIKKLKSFLPICASCKSIRNDENKWVSVESYFEKQNDITFSHGICPACVKKLYPDFCDDTQ
jgi:DNA-binding response OmpR family regulator